MKRLIMLFLLLVPVMFSLAQTGKTVNVVEMDHAPFAYLDSQTGEPKGAEVAYLTVILKELGYTPKFTFVPFARLVNMLQSGEGENDIGPLLTKTAEREAFIYFSSKPVLTMNPVLVVRKDCPVKQIKTPSDLKGLKIWFTSNLTLPPFFKDSGLSIELTSGRYVNEQNFNMLTINRYDGFIDVNPASTRWAAKTMGLTDSIRILDIPGAGTAYYFAISRKSAIASKLLKSINTLIDAKKYDFEKYLQEELK